MMFFFWKYAKLNVFLICVHKPKTTIKMKREYKNFYIKGKKKKYGCVTHLYVFLDLIIFTRLSNANI